MGELKCLNCGHPMRFDTNQEHAWWECDECWLAGPRDVLEALAARLAYANDLEETLGVMSASLERERALRPEDMVPRDHHHTVAKSRRAWMNAATSVLDPEWNGTPDDLRAALAARLAPAGVLEAAQAGEVEDVWLRVEAPSGKTLKSRSVHGDTLADAYAKLKEDV